MQLKFIGQASNLDIINSWKELPQFLIIQGDAHTGKNYFVLYLCKKFGLKYNLVGNSVKNVRALVKDMSPNSNTVYHFDNFDKATLQAKNALLKITEEPMPGNYIIITGGPQIKTLESRARRIIMAPYTLDEITEFMGESFGTSDYKNKLYYAGINTPAKVNFYKDYDKLETLLYFTYDIFDKITYISPATYIPLIKRFEDRYDKDTIDACMLFLDMLISIIEYNIKTKHRYSYINILNRLIQSKQDLTRETTLKRKMLLFKTFYDIQVLNGAM